MSRYSLLISLFLGLNILLNAQTAVQYWNTEDGLSNDWVSQVIQDEVGYIWIATQYGLNRFDGYEFKNYYYDPSDSESLSANWVRSMDQDSSGIFWLGLYLGGIDRFDPISGIAENYPLLTPDSTLAKGVLAVYCDKNQRIWATSNRGIFLKQRDANHFTFLQNTYAFNIVEDAKGNIFILSNDAIYWCPVNTLSIQKIVSLPYESWKRLYIDRNEVLWVFEADRLYKLTYSEGQWIREDINVGKYTHTYNLVDTRVLEDQEGWLWVGGDIGMTLIHPNRSETKTILYKDIFPGNRPIGKALSFFEDKHHNIWIGTEKGVFLQPLLSRRFEPTINHPQFRVLKNVRATVQIDHYQWVASQEGLYRIDLNDTDAPPIKVLSVNMFSLAHASDGYLYAGQVGLYKIDPQNLTYEYFSSNVDEQGLKGGIIWSMVEDRNKKLWIAAVGWLNRFHLETEKFERFPLNTPWYSLLLDQKDRLWIGDLFTGLYMLENAHELEDPTIAQFRQFSYDPDNDNSLSSNMILHIGEGKDGAIWAASDGGLNRIDPTDFRVKRYLKKDGLQDDKVMAILSDEEGNMWGSTIVHGIFRWNAIEDNFTFFNRKDGLHSNNYLLNSGFISPKGVLFFGSDEELQQINPEQVMSAKKTKVQFFFSHLALPNTGYDKKERIIPLKGKNEIEIAHQHKSFTIQFTTLNFFYAQETVYQYKLEGFHNDWESNGSDRELTFTGLPAGTYDLKVKASNPDLQFENDEILLSVVILPPWWSTWWAVALYGLMGLFFIYSIYRFQLSRQLAKSETQRLQELDGFKTKFYTNITHELRTPLTVILGMSEEIRKKAKKDIQHRANLIQRNGNQLLDLINQILDLSKLEAGKLPIQYVHGNVLAYLHYITEAFHSLAATKNIHLHFLPEVEEILMDYDKEKIKQIISNLLSNAIKYTPKGGNIYVQIRSLGTEMELSVRDTGVGIAKEEIALIFDRFHQAESASFTQGTGVGLALTKELISLLDGKIQVESTVGRGTTFMVQLPIRKEKDTPLEAEQFAVWHQPIAENSLEGLAEDENLPLVLIVEDNKDVVFYLVDCLKADYRLEIAYDGEEGGEKALEHIPDLIISDVMMPKKDGFELCQLLKKDMKTKHIPIILLTAKADIASKLEGLEYGADAYLPKPFERKELEIRIRKLLELRQQLQAHYQSDTFWEKPQAAENDFVMQVRALVEQNLNDSNFGILQICHQMGISRMQLHRKLKSLTNQSTSHFIRRIRLQKAKKLLQTTNLNISEIAYDVGFSDPAYFSRLYAEIFNESPSVTRK